MIESNKQIKVFNYIEELDCFLIDYGFKKICKYRQGMPCLYLNIGEWHSAVWLCRLLCLDNDYGEHLFDNWDERDNFVHQINSLNLDIDAEELMIVVPKNFIDNKDGPCHTDNIRKLFWTDVFKTLKVSYKLIFEYARENNLVNEKEDLENYLEDLEARIVEINTSNYY